MSVNLWMLELTDCPDAYVRGHGWGNVRVLVWGSQNANPQCWVRLYGSGKMLVVDQSDLRVAHNPGDPRDGVYIPKEWEPKQNAVADVAASFRAGMKAAGVVLEAGSKYATDVACTRHGCAVPGSGASCDIPGCPGTTINPS